MIDYKSFKLPGDATLRIRTEKIVATRSSNSTNRIDIFCEGIDTPFHIEANRKKPRELIDYIWNIPNFEEEDDL